MLRNALHFRQVSRYPNESCTAVSRTNCTVNTIMRRIHVRTSGSEKLVVDANAFTAVINANQAAISRSEFGIAG